MNHCIATLRVVDKVFLKRLIEIEDTKEASPENLLTFQDIADILKGVENLCVSNHR